MIDAERKLRVVQITDTHVLPTPGEPLRGVDVEGGVRAVVGHILRMEQAPDLILHTGDLIQDTKPVRSSCQSPPIPADDPYARAYERLSGLLSPLHRPVYCLPGNHDSEQSMGIAIDQDVLRGERHIIRGRWQVLMLDSSVPGSPAGHLSDQELDLTRTLLSKHEEHALICMHHSPVPIGSPWLDTMVIDNAGELLDIVRDTPHVRGIVFGHIHQPFEAEMDDILLLGSPSTGLQFKPGEDEPVVDSVPPGYRWLDLTCDGRIVSEVVRVS